MMHQSHKIKATVHNKQTKIRSIINSLGSTKVRNKIGTNKGKASNVIIINI